MTHSTVSQGIDGIFETHLPVSDLNRSISFNRDQLGLKMAHHLPDPDIAFFWIGQHSMLGLWRTGAGPLQMGLHFAFRASKDAVLGGCDTLNAAGITPLGFHGEPVTEPVVIGWMPGLTLYFKDPDGHSLEMLHLLDDPADPGFGIHSYSDWLGRTTD